MPNRARRRWYQAIVATGGLAAVAVVVPCLVVAAATPPAGSDHAEVVAQRLLQLDGGEVQWSASMMDITAATTLSSDRPTFVAVAGGSPLLIDGSDGVDVILDAGEAVFRPSAATSESSALAGGPSHAAVLGLGAPGSDGAVGDRFVPGAGAHDVELLHDTLAPGETLTLGGGLPVLLFVAGGAVTARADGSVSHSGAVEVVPGDVTITNGADVAASVFVGAVGPAIDPTSPTTSSTTADVTVTTVPAVATTSPTTPTTPPTTPPTTAPAATTLPATAPPTTPAPSTAAPLDSDGDGLSDSDEEAYGTNPGVYDTDGDGFGDGDEVFVYGTNPLDPSDHP